MNSIDILANTLKCTRNLGVKPGDLRQSNQVRCIACLHAINKQKSRKRHSDNIDRSIESYKPGEAWCLDGADPTCNGMLRKNNFLVFVDLATRYTIPYFLGKTPNALDLKEACQFVDSVSFMLTGNHMKLIHCDALSTQLEFSDKRNEGGFGEWRAAMGIELLASPPHAHHLNGIVEARIKQIKRGARARLFFLRKRIVKGKPVNWKLYWPPAVLHTCQSINVLYDPWLHRLRDLHMTPTQAFHCKHGQEGKLPDLKNFVPFAERCFIPKEAGEKIGAQMDTANYEGIVLAMGTINSLFNKGVNMPDSHIVLNCETGTVRTTGKARFPLLKDRWLGDDDNIVDGHTDDMTCKPCGQSKHSPTMSDSNPAVPVIPAPQPKASNDHLSHSESDDDIPVNIELNEGDINKNVPPIDDSVDPSDVYEDWELEQTTPPLRQSERNTSKQDKTAGDDLAHTNESVLTAKDIVNHPHTKIKCQEANPKREGTKSWERYEAYKTATTVQEFLHQNPSHGKADFINDFGKGYVWLNNDKPRDDKPRETVKPAVATETMLKTANTDQDISKFPAYSDPPRIGDIIASKEPGSNKWYAYTVVRWNYRPSPWPVSTVNGDRGRNVPKERLRMLLDVTHDKDKHQTTSDMRVRDIHPDLYGTEWRYIKRVSRKHAMLMTLAVLPALYSLQQMDVQIQRKTNSRLIHRQLCSKHAGYKEYCQAKSLGEYFDKGATVSDYRRELRAGEFWFRHPRLHVLQHYRGRDWSVLHSGGDETVSREELKFLATKMRPQGSEALSEKEEQELIRLHTKIETEAMLLHLTGPQYLAIRYQAESILHASDKESDHLYGNMYDPNESLHDYMLLMVNADKWCDSYVRKDNTADTLCQIPEDQQQTLINAARKIRWNEVKNRRRKNVMQDDRPLQSFDLLHNVSRGSEYSELHRTLMAICRKNIKGFDPNDYNSIQVNRSEFMPIHKDKPNEGSSLTIAVGNYSGGELIISRGKSPLTPNYYHPESLLLTDAIPRHNPHQTWEKLFR